MHPNYRGGMHMHGSRGSPGAHVHRGGMLSKAMSPHAKHTVTHSFRVKTHPPSPGANTTMNAVDVGNESMAEPFDAVSRTTIAAPVPAFRLLTAEERMKRSALTSMISSSSPTGEHFMTFEQLGMADSASPSSFASAAPPPTTIASAASRTRGFMTFEELALISSSESTSFGAPSISKIFKRKSKGKRSKSRSRSPKRSKSKSRSRSPKRSKSRSKSRSRSPKRSKSKSKRDKSKSRSRSPKRNKSKNKRDKSTSRSRSPKRSKSRSKRDKSKSRSRSRSRSQSSDDKARLKREKKMERKERRRSLSRSDSRSGDSSDEIDLSLSSGSGSSVEEMRQQRRRLKQRTKQLRLQEREAAKLANEEAKAATMSGEGLQDDELSPGVVLSRSASIFSRHVAALGAPAQVTIDLAATNSKSVGAAGNTVEVLANNSDPYAVSIKGIKRSMKAMFQKGASEREYVLRAYNPNPSALPSGESPELFAMVAGIANSARSNQGTLEFLARNLNVVSQAVGSEPLDIFFGKKRFLPIKSKEAPRKYVTMDNKYHVVHFAGIRVGAKSKLLHNVREMTDVSDMRQDRWVGLPVTLDTRSPFDRKRHVISLTGDSLVISDAKRDIEARSNVWYAMNGTGTAMKPHLPLLAVMRFGGPGLNAVWQDLVLVYNAANGLTSNMIGMKSVELLGSEVSLTEGLASVLDQFTMERAKASRSSSPVSSVASALAAIEALIHEPAYGNTSFDVPYARAYAGALSACVRAAADTVECPLENVIAPLQSRSTRLQSQSQQQQAERSLAAENISRAMADVAADMRRLNLDAHAIQIRAGRVFETLFHSLKAPQFIFGEKLLEMNAAEHGTANTNLEKLTLHGMAYAFGLLLTRIDPSAEGVRSLAGIWSEDALAIHDSYESLHQEYFGF